MTERSPDGEQVIAEARRNLRRRMILTATVALVSLALAVLLLAMDQTAGVGFLGVFVGTACAAVPRDRRTLRSLDHLPADRSLNERTLGIRTSADPPIAPLRRMLTMSAWTIGLTALAFLLIWGKP